MFLTFLKFEFKKFFANDILSNLFRIFFKQKKKYVLYPWHLCCRFKILFILDDVGTFRPVRDYQELLLQRFLKKNLKRLNTTGEFFRSSLACLLSH